MIAIQRIGAEGVDHAHEFVPEDERRAKDCVTDAPGLVHVQVAAAETDRLDV